MSNQSDVSKELLRKQYNGTEIKFASHCQNLAGVIISLSKDLDSFIFLSYPEVFEILNEENR